MKLIILSAVAILYTNIAFGQIDTCISNLKSAGNDYDQANYDHAITTLKNTLNGCKLSKQDQIEANKLLILCYIAIDNLEEASNTAAAIIKIDPNYMPDKFKDDPKLSALFTKFKPIPIWSLNICAGMNFPD